MNWLKVILLAIGSAFVTSLCLIIPALENTSFNRIGVYFEAWIFLAILIMANCEKPLESACKTFVFFLVSQPLIYLFQVPFSSMGWGLFGYYRFWFILTLATFPAAYVGWYIKKKNWISLLILSPILVYLTLIYVQSFQFTLRHFPLLLVTAIFCLGQVLLYLYTFTSLSIQRIIGFFVPLAIIIGMSLIRPQVQIDGTDMLPNQRTLTQAAVIQVEDEKVAQVSIVSTGEDTRIRIQASRYGSTNMTIVDGDKTYYYHLEIYEDEGGHSQIRITEQ